MTIPQELFQKTVDELYPKIAAFPDEVADSAAEVLVNCEFARMAKNVLDLFRIIEKMALENYSYDIVAGVGTNINLKSNVVNLITLLAHIELEITGSESTMRQLLKGDYERLLRSRENYGDSWIKRGGQGAFMMLARKADRIEQFMTGVDLDKMEAHFKDDSRVEGVADDLGDLRRYLLLTYGLSTALKIRNLL